MISWYQKKVRVVGLQRCAPAAWQIFVTRQKGRTAGRYADQREGCSGVYACLSDQGHEPRIRSPVDHRRAGALKQGDQCVPEKWGDPLCRFPVQAICASHQDQYWPCWPEVMQRFGKIVPIAQVPRERAVSVGKVEERWLDQLLTS